MRIFLKCLSLFAFIFVAAYVARILIVPGVVPIAEGEDPNWRIQVAFFLTSLQNVGLFGIALVVLVALPGQIKRLGRAMSAH
jgi:hypothetical protein